MLYPCLPELIWHGHLRPRSVSRPSQPGHNSLVWVQKGKTRVPTSPGDSLRESRRVSHRDSTKWACAFRRRKVIHSTQHLSEFNVKGAALITAKSVSFWSIQKGVRAAMRCYAMRCASDDLGHVLQIVRLGIVTTHNKLECGDCGEVTEINRQLII